MPDLTGRRAIVTGANSGIGFETAKALAAHGAQVTLAVRDLTKGVPAAAAAGSNATAMRLDLADLSSVRDFAAEWSATHPEGLDLLINNAGIMAIPRTVTPDGFEAQTGHQPFGAFCPHRSAHARTGRNSELSRGHGVIACPQNGEGNEFR